MRGKRVCGIDIIARASFTVLAIALLNQFVVAQPANWSRFTSDDGSFSVELPKLLIRVKSFDGERGIYDQGGQDERFQKAYSAIETSADEARFGINVLKLPAEYGNKNLSWNEVLEYLAVILIGDDDDSEPDIERPVKSNKLEGTEYYFVREEKRSESGSTGSIFTRGRVFDLARRRVVVLTFIGRSRAELDSKDANRFLNSFMVLK